jgi:hypothetical protein
MQNAGCLHVVAEIVTKIQGKPPIRWFTKRFDSAWKIKMSWSYFAARGGPILSRS